MYTPSDNPVQLVKHLHKVPESKRIFPALASIKYDGVYAFALPDGRIFSRAGKECTSLLEQGEKVREGARKASMSGLAPHVIIFEVYAYGWPVNKISGAFRKKKEQFKEAVCIVHDAIPYSNFTVGETSAAFQYRALVARMYSEMLGWPYVQQRLMQTEEEAYAYAKHLIEDGHEGIVLRDPNAGWKAGARNETCTKIKIEERSECKVTGVEAGVGKNEGVASVIVKFNKHTQTVSGGSYEDRRRWLHDPEEVVGKTAIIEYMCLTPNGKMREPRLKGFK